jgi:putrescine aminotransferase
MGNRLLEQLRTLEPLEHVGDVRGLGLMAGVELVADKTTKKAYAATEKVGPRLHQEMAKRGLYTRVSGETICLAPPLISSTEQIDRIVDIVRDSISAAL